MSLCSKVLAMDLGFYSMCKKMRHKKTPTDTGTASATTTPGSENCGTSTASPVNKRRGRKWLPPPLRKLSQGKVDKPVERPLIKKSSDKRFKLPSDKQSVEEESLTQPTSPLQNAAAAGDAEQEEEPVLEIPPPMKPIQDSASSNAGEPSSMKQQRDATGGADILEIERIVKEKMEQHEGKHPRALDTLSSIDEVTVLTEDGNEENLDDPSSAESALRRRNFALKELVSTEEKYIEDLALIVDGYMAEVKSNELPIPDDLKGGKEKMVFANIASIYEWHRDHFFKNLQPCIQNPSTLGPLIDKSKIKLRQYIVYCQNKPVSEHIVSEHYAYFEEVRTKLKHKLVINDLLIKPVQRLMKYELMLKDILKHTERAGLLQDCTSLRHAINVMNAIIKEANDMMDVGRLQNFEGKITAQGNLLLHGLLSCIEVNNNSSTSESSRNSSGQQKPKELQVFLFDQCVIFSEIVGKKTQFTNPAYIYKLHVQLNKMSLKDISNSAGDKFLIKSTDHKRQGLGFICTGATPELHKKWFERITDLLRAQTDFANAIQRPIDYLKEKELNKNSSKSVPNTPIGLPPEYNSARQRSSHPNNKYQSQYSDGSISLTSAAVNQNKLDNRVSMAGSNKAAVNNNCSNGGGNAPATPPSPHLLLNNGQLVHNGNRLSAVEESVYNNNHPTKSMMNSRLSRDFNHHLTLAIHENNLNNNNNNHIYSNVVPNQTTRNNFAMPPSPSSSSVNSNQSTSPSIRSEITSRSQDITVNEGSSAILSCRIKNHQYSKITWRKVEPETVFIRQDDKYDLSITPNGEARLIIKHTRILDTGLYVCSIENVGQNHQPFNLQCTIGLIVIPTPNAANVYEPSITIVDSKTISVTWTPTTPCLVESCQIGQTEWRKETKNPVTPNYEIKNLKSGESYSFRLINPSTGLVGVSSLTVTLPTNDAELWQQQHFSHRYSILSELGRGRCAVVKLARDTGTGQLVASKQISRNLQSIARTQSEYKIIASIQHSNIVKGLCLYQNAPHPGTDTIVMEYVHGPYLFAYICKNKEYTETTVQFFMKQLLNAVSWLHGQNLLHLDIKPENILVDVSNIYSPVLKLIDFGNYVKYSSNESLQLNNLEFAAPETLMESQLLIGRHTDMWAIGVFLYVFLSGVSPFLDDSSEETTTNILKCDYCFPEDYFKISNEAIQLCQSMLLIKPENRISVEKALNSPWITQNLKVVSVIATARLQNFVDRRSNIFFFK